MSTILFALLNGFFWALVLRGPYWLYKRYKGEPIRFWWPWGVVIGAGFALASAATLGATY